MPWNGYDSRRIKFLYGRILVSYMAKRAAKGKKTAEKDAGKKSFRWHNKRAKDFFMMTGIVAMIAVFGFITMYYSEGMVRYYTLGMWYDLVVYAAVIFGLLIVGFRRFFPEKYYKAKGVLFFVLLFPFAMLPIFSCYFGVPMIFCRICPNPCVFGVTRAYSFSGFFLMNLRNRHFCNHMCPLGTMQDCSDRIMTKKLVLPKVLRAVRWLVLAGVVIVVGMTQSSWGTERLGVQPHMLYWPSMIVVGVFFMFLLLSYIVPRVWCNSCCPVGALGDAMLWVQKKVFRRK